ncbi:MAG: TetR family transcriptional regulator [Mariprofundales bacterium]
MKVTKKERKKTRLKLIAAAVDIITEKGFKAATMRDFSRKAGVSDATIYNYFPTKEKILVAYFEEHQLKAINILQGIEDFHTYTLQEQLQTLIETKFDLLLADREFVAIAVERAFQTLISSKSEMAQVRIMMIEVISDMLDAAIEAGEIPEQPYQTFIPALINDLYLGLLCYWLKDISENFSNTSQLVDKSLDLTVSLLRSGIISKSLDIVSFLFRQHIASYLEKMADFSMPNQEINKRKFMSKDKQGKKHE